MTSPRAAHVWHTITLVAALAALVYQFWLIATGRGYMLDKTTPVEIGEQIRRYFSYFTIQSNILVAVGTAMILAGRTDNRAFRLIRLASIIGITVTGVVAYLLLTPPSDFPAASLLADRLLHRVVPIVAVIGWVLFGPRGRAGSSDIVPSLAWPVSWLVATLALGPVFGWYPYPFLNVDKIGLSQTLVNCLVVAVLFVGLAFAAIWADRRLLRSRATMTA